VNNFPKVHLQKLLAAVTGKLFGCGINEDVLQSLEYENRSGDFVDQLLESSGGSRRVSAGS
jgi:hypothetical protein